MKKLLTVPSRQRVEALTISQTPLGVGGSVVSDIRLAKGYSAIKLLVRSDRAGTLEVLESVTNPSGGPTFIQTFTGPTAADPLTAEQVAYTTVDISGSYVRVRFTNTSGLAQSSFQISANLLPVR